MYPADRSDFTRNTPLSAYFFVGDELWQTNGFALLNDFTGEVRDRLLARFALRDADGTPITAADVPSESAGGFVWNAQMLRVLFAAAQALRAPASVLDQIVAGLRAGTVSPASVAAMLWVTYTNQSQDVRNGRATGTINYGFGSPADVNIPEGSVLPAFGTTIAAGPSEWTGVTRRTVPRAEQPRALPVLVRPTSTSFLVAFGLFAVVATVGALAMSTVKSRPTRRNPSRKRRRRSA